jgi:hypothetical protein
MGGGAASHRCRTRTLSALVHRQPASGLRVIYDDHNTCGVIAPIRVWDHVVFVDDPFDRARASRIIGSRPVELAIPIAHLSVSGNSQMATVTEPLSADIPCNIETASALIPQVLDTRIVVDPLTWIYVQRAIYISG